MIFFKIEPHLTDVRLRIKGDDLKELFTSGYKGLYQLLLPSGCSDYDHPLSECLVHSIHINSPNVTTLLIDFLSEILSVCKVEKAIYCTLEILNISPTHVDAQLTGHLVPEFGKNIKGVSHHEVDVKKSPEGQYETMVIFDI